MSELRKKFEAKHPEWNLPEGKMLKPHYEQYKKKKAIAFTNYLEDSFTTLQSDYDKLNKRVEDKIKSCDELGGMEKEKWAFIQCLKMFKIEGD